jgi:uncharacterized integral membrane protein
MEPRGAMKSFLTWLVLLPSAALLLLFALLNRQIVGLSLNPFAIDIPELQIDAPLFLVVFAAFIGGVLCGACLNWLGHGPQRQRLRALRAENEHLRHRIAHLPHLPEI